ncbi:MAG: tetratricopeptide repeat protein [Dehalococcoidia bacterium]|nr:tetratricopeptide repeat protein [Dehalococcoidia bacterium]
MGFLFGKPISKKAKEIYKQADREKQEALLKVESVFEGLDERDRALMVAANIGIITCPARLSTRLEAHRQIMDELDYMLTQEGISAIDEMLGAERTLLKQARWGEFVEDWKEKWSIHNEKDIGFWGYRHKKLQPYVYEFGYYYQTPADYKDKGPLKLPANVGTIGPRKIVSWRVDIKSNSVTPIIQPVSNQLEKGLVLASRCRNEEAIVEFNRYIKVRPNDPIAYEVRGDSHYDTGQFGKAIDDYSTSIELEPRLAEAYDKRAITYAEIGDFEKSIKDLTKAIELYPENAEYYFNRSVTYDRLGDTDKAIDDCTEAIELDRNYAKAYYSRGIAYSEKGEYDKAISDFDIAIKLHPEFTADVYFNRGVAYQAKGEYKKALEDFKRVRKNVSDREDIEVVEQKIRELTSR